MKKDALFIAAFLLSASFLLAGCFNLGNSPNAPLNSSGAQQPVTIVQANNSPATSSSNSGGAASQTSSQEQTGAALPNIYNLPTQDIYGAEPVYPNETRDFILFGDKPAPLNSTDGYYFGHTNFPGYIQGFYVYNLTYVSFCCLNRSIYVQRGLLYIKSTGEPCKCLSGHNLLFFTTKPLKGARVLTPVGQKVLPALGHLAFCHTDEDCINAFSCCHQGSQPCISYFLKHLLPQTSCKGIYCTQECRPCNHCKCVNEACESDMVGGCC